MRTVQLLVFTIFQSLTFINPSTPQTKFRMTSRTSTIQHGETKKHGEKSTNWLVACKICNTISNRVGGSIQIFTNLCWLIPLGPFHQPQYLISKVHFGMGKLDGIQSWNLSFWRSFGWTNSLPSGKLTWQWKMNLLKIYSLLKMGIFHCYVWLPECRWMFPKK